MAKLCPNCKLPVTSIKAVIMKNHILTGCDKCIDSLSRPNEMSAAHRRSFQQRQYRRDLVQPFEHDFVKAYGVEAAREQGWSDEAIRKHA